MRVKVCGVTRRQDARLAERLGAHEIGCVLVPDTPRALGVEDTLNVLRGLAPQTVRVLVFRGEALEVIERAIDITGADIAQLHQTPETVATSLELRGVRVRRVLDVHAGGLLQMGATTGLGPQTLDVGGGGGGRRFDWSLLQDKDLRHVMIAGGITPENVAELTPYHPLGIDVSSGVESAPGIKSEARLRDLMARIMKSEELPS